MQRCGRDPIGPRTSAAFTLVELLVVIGIIAVLLGLLLPALNRARQVSQRTVCLSKLHQIGLAAAVHATAHRGYYPLAGYLPVVDPVLLNDADRAKYDYGDFGLNVFVSNGTTASAALQPVTNALALVMRTQQLIGATNDQTGTYETDGTAFIRNFICPSQASDPSTITCRPGLQGLPTLYSTDPTLGDYAYYTQAMSYVWNEYVLGWDTSFETYPTRRLRGQASRVRLPAQTVFAADGLGTVGRTGGRITGGLVLAMATVYNTGAPDPGNNGSTVPVSLVHALNGDALAGNPGTFDRKRHQGKMNIVFCDGHAETRTINGGGDLNTVYIVPP